MPLANRRFYTLYALTVIVTILCAFGILEFTVFWWGFGISWWSLFIIAVMLLPPLTLSSTTTKVGLSLGGILVIFVLYLIFHDIDMRGAVPGEVFVGPALFLLCTFYLFLEHHHNERWSGIVLTLPLVTFSCLTVFYATLFVPDRYHVFRADSIITSITDHRYQSTDEGLRLCNTIWYDTMKQQCIARLAMQENNMQLCKDYGFQNCIAQFAIVRSDADLCPNDEFYHDYCITQIAVQLKDLSLCNEINYYAPRQQACRLFIENSIRSVEDCDAIADRFDLTQCKSLLFSIERTQQEIGDLRDEMSPSGLSSSATHPPSIPPLSQPQSSTINTALLTSFTSQHRFQLDYPSSWIIRVDLENYPSIAEAQTVGGNHLTLTSFDQSKRDDSPYWQQGDLKIEGWLYDRDVLSDDQFIPDTSEEWAREQEHLLQSSSLTIDGKSAVEAVVMMSYGEDVIADQRIHQIFLVHGNRAARFTLYPKNPTEETLVVFREIIQSFRFL